MKEIGISVLLLIIGGAFVFAKYRSNVSDPKVLVSREFSAKFQEILKQVEAEAGKIDGYYESFSAIDVEERVYKFNFFQEELLKKLIKLDEIDLTVLNDEHLELKNDLKSERKAVIRRIQTIQKSLDAFKKSNIKEFE